MTETELLNFLGGLPDNQENLPKLAKQVASRTGLIPFVGAGISYPYHFPLWDQFIRGLAERAGVVEEVNGQLKDLKYEEAAELLQSLLKADFQAQLAEKFGEHVLEGVEYRGAVAQVPNVTTGLVITTNFDPLLEHAFDIVGHAFPLKVWHDKVGAVIGSINLNALLLLKLHGDWQHPDERVLTLSEYTKYYGEDRTKVNFELAIPKLLSLLVLQPLLFLGCSLKQDRTVQIMTQLAARVEFMRHYAILEYPGEGAAYDQRRAELDRMHIQPVWYPQGEHDRIEHLLRYLAEQVPEPLRLVKKKPAAAAKKNTLPRPDNSFVGRETEQADLRDIILQHPLVTVTGSPGAGKTRLTIQVASSLLEQFDAFWFVPLSQFSDAAALPQRIAHIMGLQGKPAADLLDVVAAALKPGRQMLILDSCEAAWEGCAGIARKLRAECPDLHLVLTSRISLGYAVAPGAEHLYRVPPMQTPEPALLFDLQALERIDSVKLLKERAGAQSTFRLTDANARKVAMLCRYVDGIPLAIELVAAQIDMRSLDSVLKHWDERIEFQAPGGAGQHERQAKILSSTIGLSYNLLRQEPNGERLCRLFERLAVFHRGWLSEAALAVCGEPGEEETDVLDLLTPLRRASLIEVEEVAGDKRYRYLDAIREFALEHLTADEAADYRARHADWATEFAERLAPEILTARQATTLAKMIGEADNLRGAILWAKAREDGEMAVRLTTAIWRVMEIKGFYREGIDRLNMALALPGTAGLPVLRSKALSGLSILAYRQGDLDTSERCSTESLQLEHEGGNAAGVANAMNDLGNVAQLRGEYQKALAFYEGSLVINRKIGDGRGIAVGLFNCGRQDTNLGHLKRAEANLQASLEMFDDAGNWREAAFALNGLGVLARLQGRNDEALRYAGSSLDIRQKLEDRRGIAETMRTQAAVLIGKQDFASARQLLEKSGNLAREIGDVRGVMETLEHLAWLNSAEGQPAIATILSTVAARLREGLHLKLPPVEEPALAARLAAARESLGEQAFAAQLEIGRLTTPEEALGLGINQRVQTAQTNQ